MGEDKEILILDSNGNPSEDGGSSQYDLKVLRVGSPPAGAYRAIRTKIRSVRRTQLSTFHRVTRVHGKPLLSALLTMISSTASFIFFPIYLESLTENEHVARSSDGYSACLLLTTCTTALFLIVAIFLQTAEWLSYQRRRVSIFFPEVSWVNILKIGVSTALSFLTVCSAWEDHKVLCNMQLPLLGFVFVFASITHAISRWKELGFRRSFSILAIICGIFISVDFTLVDNERCRGQHPPPKDRWTWKVHLVWTLAFVVAIWLWTVAIFSMESSIPLVPRIQRQRKAEESGVRMRVLKVESLEAAASHHQLPARTGIPMRINSDSLISDDIYTKIPIRSIFKALLWYHISTWIIILSLFWTEFIPGFGKGVHDEEFSLFRVLENAFLISVTIVPFWSVLVSTFIFAHAFAYLVISIRSPLIAIGVMCVGFPSVGLWWSLFQTRSPSAFLVWMPMVTEVICALLGFPLILGGTLYLFLLDVFRRSKIPHVLNRLNP